MSQSDDHDDALGGTMLTVPGGRKKDAPDVESVPEENLDRYGGPSSELGRGGIGRVLMQHDVSLQREVAVKELLPAYATSAGTGAGEVRERFVTEARVLAKLEHPGIVPIYELGRRRDGTLYYSMKRVRGRSLEQALEACATFSDRSSLLPHLLDVAQTMAFAHSKGVIHRDLKPANVMVGSFGETQVLDWGLARVRGMAEPKAVAREMATHVPASSVQTTLGQVMGTPTHMSPEQARGDVQSIDERSDVWSLGVMLFEVLTGQTPFDADDVNTLLEKVRSAPVPTVASVEPKAPRSLAAIAERALHRDRNQRYPTAVELAEALEKALGSPSAPRRSPVMALAAIGFSLVAAVFAGLWLSASGREDDLRVRQEKQRIEVDQGRAAALGQLAVSALERKDFAAAERWSAQAALLGRNPRAMGAAMVARSTPHPQLEWSVRTEGGCTAVTVSGNAVACATFGAVTIHDAANGHERGRLSVGPTGWQRAAVFLPDEAILLSGGDDKLVHVWDARELKELDQWKGHQSPITAMAITASGARLATGSLDGEVRTWERATGVSKVVTKLDASVRALAFAADGRLAMSTQHQAFVWKPEASAPSVTLDHAASAFLFAGSDTLVAVERTIFSIDAAIGRRWRGPLDDVTSLLRLRDGTLVAGDARGELWSFDDDGAVVSRLSGFEPGISGLATGDDALLVVATRDKRLEGWRWQRTAPIPPMGNPTVARYDGRLLLGQRAGEVWRSAQGGGFETLAGKHIAAVRALASAQGQVLSGGDDGRVLWRKAEDDKVLELAKGGSARVTAVAMSADATLAAWAFDDGTRVVFQLALQKEVSSVREAVARSLAFSRDGTQLAVGFDDKRVQLFDALTGTERRTLQGFDAFVSQLAFSADGSWLAASTGTSVQLVDLLAGRVKQQLSGPTGRVGVLDFSPDSALLAAGSDDGDAWVWDVHGGALLLQLPLFASDVTALSFNGPRSLVAGGADRSLRVISLER